MVSSSHVISFIQTGILASFSMVNTEPVNLTDMLAFYHIIFYLNVGQVIEIGKEMHDGLCMDGSLFASKTFSSYSLEEDHAVEMADSLFI